MFLCFMHNNFHSNKRDIFRAKSAQNLLEDSCKDDLDTSQGSFLGESMFNVLSDSEWPQDMEEEEEDIIESHDSGKGTSVQVFLPILDI